MCIRDRYLEGGARIPDDIVHDWVNGVIWHQLFDAMLWKQALCNLATLKAVSLGRAQGAQLSQGRGRVTPGHRLCLGLCVPKIWVAIVPPGPTSQRVLQRVCYRRYRQGSCVGCHYMSWAMSPFVLSNYFGPCLYTTVRTRTSTVRFLRTSSFRRTAAASGCLPACFTAPVRSTSAGSRLTISGAVWSSARGLMTREESTFNWTAKPATRPVSSPTENGSSLVWNNARFCCNMPSRSVVKRCTHCVRHRTMSYTMSDDSGRHCRWVVRCRAQCEHRFKVRVIGYPGICKGGGHIFHLPFFLSSLSFRIQYSQQPIFLDWRKTPLLNITIQARTTQKPK